MLGTLGPPVSTDASVCKRQQIPGPHEFAVSLQAHVNKVDRLCALYGHSEEENLSQEDEMMAE
jgi:hypothetical protein